MQLPFDDVRYSPDASGTFLAIVKRGLCEINKNNRANATQGLSPVQKMFRDRTEVILDWRGPGPRPGPVLTLVTSYSGSKC